MQIRRMGYRIRGFGRITDYAVRYLNRMATKAAERRAEALAFWNKYGLEATKEAFKASERSLYGWKAMFKAGQSRTEALDPKSKKPKSVRQRNWPEIIKNEIKRLRTEHPNLGKDKIHPLLARFCEAQGFVCPKTATIGNLIKDMGGLRMFPTKVRHDGTVVPRKRAPATRKPKDFKANHPGHCIALDTVERFTFGMRRYLITFVDLHSRFAFAVLTTSHASLAAKQFFDMIRIVFPYKLEFVLTDNGSEFMKCFDAELRRLCLIHWHTYPRTPKMNAHCERFNRTVQEDFVDYNVGLLMDPHAFNLKLMDWLVWYNAERPHKAFDNRQSPLQFLLSKQPEDCKMYLAHTTGCFSRYFLLKCL